MRRGLRRDISFSLQQKGLGGGVQTIMFCQAVVLERVGGNSSFIHTENERDRKIDR